MGHLQKTERQEIEYYLKKGYNNTKIGALLDRDRSVIRREITRNSVNGAYRSEKASVKSYQRRYWVRTDSQKIVIHPELEKYIEDRLRERNPWSPEQIAGRWKETKVREYGYTISAPSIYKYLYK